MNSIAKVWPNKSFVSKPSDQPDACIWMDRRTEGSLSFQANGFVLSVSMLVDVFL